MQDIQNGNYERSVNGKKTVDNGSHFLTAFYKLVVPTAMLLPIFLWACLAGVLPLPVLCRTFGARRWV